MGHKRIIVDHSEWIIPDNAVDDVLQQVTDALEGGKVGKLGLVDQAGRPVTVFLNGRATTSVVVDQGADAKPSEISGKKPGRRAAGSS